MARIFPALDDLDHLSVPLNEGEHQVLEAFRQLDDGWTVYVQPRLGLDQPDYVVMHPLYGVTAVEVKDWGHGCYRQTTDGFIEVFTATDGWIRTRHSPKFQAARYLDAVWSRFFADANASPQRAIVRASVVMPRYTTADAQALLRITRFPSEHGVTVWGGDDLERSVFLPLTNSVEPTRRQIPPIAIDRLRRALAEPEAVADLRLPLRLSDAAKNIENNTSNATVRRVRGAAGSGKSLGLAARAARLSAEGKEVLVISFNSTLPHYLHDLAMRRCRQVDGNINLITCTHLHALCRRAVENSSLAGFENLATTLPGLADPFEQLVDEAIDAYGRGHGRTFDAVLVDEGQDFTPKWWNFLREHVCRPEGEMLLVADPTQDVYDNKSWTDEKRMLGAGFSGPWAEVRGSYRMPPDLIPKIAAFAVHHVSGARVEPMVPPDHPQQANEYQPTVRRWVNATGASSIGTHLGFEVLALMASQPDLSPNDIVFLAQTHEDGLDAVAVLDAAGVPVQHIFARSGQEQSMLKRNFFAAAPGVKGCTVQSFKGWESRAVVMSVASSQRSHQLAYVALTRVKGDAGHRSAFVTVVNNDQSLHRYGEYFMAV